MNGNFTVSFRVFLIRREIHHYRLSGQNLGLHMHEGLYMIMLKSDLKTIDKIQKFTSLDNKKSSLIYTYMFQNRVVFTDNTRFYVFDDIKNKILP